MNLGKQKWKLAAVVLTDNIMFWRDKLVSVCFCISTDNVCIDSMSLTINRNTLERCSQNLTSLQSNIQK